MNAHIKFSASLSLVAIVASAVIGLILGVSTHHVNSGGLSVQVNGNFSGPVNVHVSGSIKTDEKKTLIKGDGKEVEQGKQVLVRVSSFSYTRSGYVQTLNPGVLKAGSATKDELKQLYPLIVGAHEGSRLMAVIPDQNKTSAEIVVVDLLPTVVQGDMQSVSDLEGGITLSDNEGIPVVHGTGESLQNTQVEIAIPSEGEQISDKEVIYANYLIADTSGKIQESTYEKSAPAYIRISDIFADLSSAISEQRVGSRIIATVPSAQARGDGDIVLVMDILACEEEGKNGVGSAGDSVS